MTKEKENALRERLTAELKSYFDAKGEDTGYIESNQFNFPSVSEDGEELWYRITVSVPHYSEDDDEGYSLRQSYELKVKERKEKAEKLAREKAEKLEKKKKKATTT